MYKGHFFGLKWLSNTKPSERSHCHLGRVALDQYGLPDHSQHSHSSSHAGSNAQCINYKVHIDSKEASYQIESAPVVDRRSPMGGVVRSSASRIASIVNAKRIEAGLGGMYRGWWAEEGLSVA